MWSFGAVNSTYTNSPDMYSFTSNGFSGDTQEEVLTLEPSQLEIMSDIEIITCTVAGVYEGELEVSIIQLGSCTCRCMG